MTGRPHRAVADVRVAVRHALREYVQPGEPVTVACSGGADSMALAAALAFEAPRQGLSVGAVTVDHGLQDGSSRRAQEVASRLRELGLGPVAVRTVVVPPTREGGPEARAREARYAALALEPGWTVLGHTRDDQAETVLLGLGRGSGPRSIAGMSARNEGWLRPLLDVPRATTRAACAAEGLPVWDDPHNHDPSFTRVRLRHEVLPLLEEVLQGGVAAALARTAEQLREDGAVLDGLADAVPLEEAPGVDVLAALPAALRRRVLRRWLVTAAPLAAVHLHAVDALITDWRGQGAAVLPGGWAVSRASGRLHLQPAAPPAPAAPEAAHRDVSQES